MPYLKKGETGMNKWHKSYVSDNQHHANASGKVKKKKGHFKTQCKEAFTML